MNSASLLRLATRLVPGLAATITSATAAQLTATVTIPQLNVSEYHRPYVAIWIETADRTVAANVGVWYDINLKNAEGETWLKDLRQWWRRSGRELDLPVDGVSGPTRPVGVHEVKLADTITSKLTQGDYTLVVEAAREVGGRELVRVPFNWSPSAKIDTATSGKTELGAITLKSN